MEDFISTFNENFEIFKDDKPQLNWITSELCVAHRNELISNIKWEPIDVPNLFIDSAWEMLQDEIDKYISSAKLPEVNIDIVSFIDEWSSIIGKEYNLDD